MIVWLTFVPNINHLVQSISDCRGRYNRYSCKATWEAMVVSPQSPTTVGTRLW